MSTTYKEAATAFRLCSIFITQGEAHSLINAFETKGSLPRKLQWLWIGRRVICAEELPELLKALGVDELTVYSGGLSEPIIIIEAIQ